jgi:hypothetical protein
MTEKFKSWVGKEIPRIIVKKYKTISCFPSLRCSLKISKKKELRLREIVKEILKLHKEMEDLFEDNGEK